MYAAKVNDGAGVECSLFSDGGDVEECHVQTVESSSCHIDVDTLRTIGMMRRDLIVPTYCTSATTILCYSDISLPYSKK